MVKSIIRNVGVMGLVVSGLVGHVFGSEAMRFKFMDAYEGVNVGVLRGVCKESSSFFSGGQYGYYDNIRFAVFDRKLTKVYYAIFDEAAEDGVSALHWVEVGKGCKQKNPTLQKLGVKDELSGGDMYDYLRVLESCVGEKKEDVDMENEFNSNVFVLLNMRTGNGFVYDAESHEVISFKNEGKALKSDHMDYALVVRDKDEL